MAQRLRRLGDLPREFAVFPLGGALLLPGGRLPLNIFEPRYLAMVDDALAGDRMFGMIQPNHHAPDGANGPALYSIGCLGRLVYFSETDDGRYLITLQGIRRFLVREEIAPRHGYRRVAADFSPFAEDGADTPLELPRRDELLAALRVYFDRFGIDASWDVISSMENNSLITTLAMLCPFEDPEKQALLEAPTPEDRAADLLALLRIAVHEQDGVTRPA
jgi:Lon protease-like protein